MKRAEKSGVDRQGAVDEERLVVTGLGEQDPKGFPISYSQPRALPQGPGLFQGEAV